MTLIISAFKTFSTFDDDSVDTLAEILETNDDVRVPSAPSSPLVVSATTLKLMVFLGNYRLHLLSCMDDVCVYCRQRPSSISGSSSGSVRLKRCSQCKMCTFCSKQCQKVHWKLGHKHYCSIVQRRHDEPDEEMEKEEEDDDTPNITSVDVWYRGSFFERVEDINRLADRSRFFEAVVHRWNKPSLQQDGRRVYDFPPLDFASVRSIQTTLKTLEGETDIYMKMLLVPVYENSSSSSSSSSFSLDIEIVQLAFYLGCEKFLLPIYCRNSQHQHRLDVAHYVSDEERNLYALLSTSGFFEGMYKHDIPLCCIKFCQSLPMAKLLLTAYRTAPTSTLRSVLGLFFRGGKSAEHFAMTALERFSSRVHWDGEDMDEILLHISDDNACNSKEYLKPNSVEDVVYYVILRKRVIPKVFMRWDMDPSLISQALFQANRLDEAITFSNRTDIIACLVERWTVEECICNLQADHGGFRKLFECQQDTDCAWLASIPKLVDIYRHEADPSAINVQELVYRRLFMHVDFDPLVPPRFLESLTMIHSDDKKRQRALRHAVMYLEQGKLAEASRLNLPWEKLSLDLLERTALALQDDESNRLWRRLDITKIQQEEALHCVPAKLLAIQVLEKLRRLERALEQEKSRTRRLEVEVVRLSGRSQSDRDASSSFDWD